jgi:hypothetical protein
MLKKLALKHNLWVKMAKGICKDAYLADDLVSEMYLKFSEYDKEVNDFYVYYAIKHIYINWLREEKKMPTTELNDNFVTFEEKERITIELPDCLTWVEKQILILRQDYSCREIEKQYHIQYKKVNRIELLAKEKCKQWIKEKSQVLGI